MTVHLPRPPTRRRSAPSPRVRRGVPRLPSEGPRREPHRVVRVRIGRGTYAYRATRPVGLGQIVRVVAFGRGGYQGPLKDAYPVAS